MSNAKQRNLFPVAKEEFAALPHVQKELPARPATIQVMLDETKAHIEAAKARKGQEDSPYTDADVAAFKAFTKKWNGYGDRKESLLSDDLIAKVAHSTCTTWSAIAADVQTDDGTTVTNSEAVEVCWDADRLKMYGGDTAEEAEAEINLAIEHHGYPDVLAFVAKHIKLV